VHENIGAIAHALVFVYNAEYLHESATVRLQTDMIALEPQAIYDKNAATLQDTPGRVVQTSGRGV